MVAPRPNINPHTPFPLPEHLGLVMFNGWVKVIVCGSLAIVILRTTLVAAR